jgi:DNA helicase II / ATP-dependent DNA helicase PcrA
MAEKIAELEQIFGCISRGENFLLSGGAGSGKTYSLVQVLKRIYSENPKATIACITYTNVAVNEIKERAPFRNLRASTIHDFLWDMIVPFQNNLKASLVELAKNEKLKYPSNLDRTVDQFKDIRIDYKEWVNIEKGEISHDEVIMVAEHMFAQYPLLCDIVKDKFDFILIDEYQDTFNAIITILLNHLQKSKKKNILGFFGDSMQSIYDDGAGNINGYIEAGIVKEIVKKDNRRNPQTVIDLINKLRLQTDQLHQESIGRNREEKGSITFLYRNQPNGAVDMDKIKQLKYFDGWDFSSPVQTKELYLTHNLIAGKAGFPQLMAIYDKDRIIEYKGKITVYVKDNDLSSETESKSFGEVADQLRPKVKMSKGIQEFIQENPDLWSEAKGYPFDVMRKIYLDKDQLIGNKKGSADEAKKKGEKRDPLIKHLMEIQECIFYYQSARFNEFIKKTHYFISSVKDKNSLKEAIDTLSRMNEGMIEEVIEYADEKNIWKKDGRLNQFIKEKEYVYNRVKRIKYQEIVNLFNYVEGYTLYSTQHNIKGDEFDNVFLVLDNGGWNNYNFEYLFNNRTDKASVLKRTQQIFYVCCSRAKKNLVVFYDQPSDSTIKQAKEWFGNENVISLE